MKALRVLAVALVVLLLGAASPFTPLYGFSLQNSARERQLEAAFLDVPTAEGALEATETIAAEPHYAGSYGDHELALFMRDKLREYGFDATLETFTAQVDTPRRLLLQLLPNGPTVPPPAAAAGAPTVRGHIEPPGLFSRSRRRPGPQTITLALREPAPAMKPTDVADADPDAGTPITSNAVGLPFNAGSADGDVVAPLVYVARGTAADYAALAAHDVDVRGAVALIRYGAEFRGMLAARAQAHGAVGVIFYNDPADDGFARGPAYPSGPWRPGYAVERGTVGSGIRIPTLPISADNARLLLGALQGPAGARGWRGALPVVYPYARGPAYVRLVVHLDRRRTTLWNTIGRIPGLDGTQTVVVGAHRDAWVYGASDNGSGVVALLELARGFGYLLQSGWHPQRTLVVAGWDGEELGDVGSVAYVQRHREELLRGGVAYLNADDVAIGPYFTADAAAVLGPALVDATRAVSDPAARRDSVLDEWAAQDRTPFPVPVAPGGGSDHASFLFDVGTPTANMAFTGPLGGYHSSSDTLQFALAFGDPGFVRHRVMAQLYGLLALRLADADAVPYAFTAYVPPLRATLTRLRADATAAGLHFDDAAFASTIEAFAASATRFDTLTAQAADAPDAERALAAARVLDLAAYGADGYGASLFPALDRALAERDPQRFAAAVAQARDALQRATQLLADTTAQN